MATQKEGHKVDKCCVDVALSNMIDDHNEADYRLSIGDTLIIELSLEVEVWGASMKEQRKPRPTWTIPTSAKKELGKDVRSDRGPIDEREIFRVGWAAQSGYYTIGTTGGSQATPSTPQGTCDLPEAGVKASIQGIREATEGRGTQPGATVSTCRCPPGCTEYLFSTPYR
ncbi:hypothetical protein CLAIMM_15180 isoform 2 [Cladophialophora immunda]|nr:hypothetical protein CLAIMM_15180 isoform 1 [Cladophialophora immunda]OQV11329.1 hypothetical protein CLAIMM_15180 isoform 2 [Cladophialophora immunda]